MNPLPNVTSRPVPVPPLTSYGSGSFQKGAVAPASSTLLSSSQYPRPRGPDSTHNHAPKLPSIQTLLEPEILDPKPLEPPPRLSGVQAGLETFGRHDSSSPTLKRRRDFDPYGYEQPASNATASQVSLAHRNAHGSSIYSGQPLSYGITEPLTTSRLFDPPHQSRYGGPPYTEINAKPYRPASTPSSLRDFAGSHVGQGAREDAMDITKHARRRTEGTSRAPLRASRCLGQQEIPGEGLCYIYEDGTYCRAVIDGEQVNPNWGVTKAGKPRKRLAQACLTCREKKIKCEPGYPKCLQCAKSQRACRG